MDLQMRNLLAGGGAFVVLGVVALLIGAPGVLGVVMILAGMVMLGLFASGHETVPAFFEARRANLRRSTRERRTKEPEDDRA